MEDLSSLQHREKSQFLSEIPEVGSNDADLKTNTHAHILTQEVRSHGKEILFFLTYLFSFTKCCCYSLFSFVL